RVPATREARPAPPVPPFVARPPVVHPPREGSDHSPRSVAHRCGGGTAPRPGRGRLVPDLGARVVALARLRRRRGGLERTRLRARRRPRGGARRRGGARDRDRHRRRPARLGGGAQPSRPPPPRPPPRRRAHLSRRGRHLPPLRPRPGPRRRHPPPPR